LFGLSESVRIREVYWACDPDRLQVTRRLAAAFQEAGIPQRRLQGEDNLLMGSGSSLGFILAENSLKALRLRSGDFSALVQYEAFTSPEPASLWVGSFVQELPGSRVLLAVGPRPLADSARETENKALIAVADWTWVEVITNGQELRVVAVK
jgi:hypothetical protein